MSGTDRWLVAWGVGYAAVGLASLLVPLYALTLGADAFAVGVLASTAAFAGVPGAILWGWLATRTGRRRVFVLLALGTTGVVLAAMPFVRSILVLVGANALLWFFVAAAAPVLTLLVVDGHDEDHWERRIGRLNAVQGYGWVAGLLLGSVWLPIVSRWSTVPFAQRSLFGIGAVLGVVGLPFAHRWLPDETTVGPERIVRSAATLDRLARGSGRVRTVPFTPGRLYWRLSAFRPARLRDRFSGTLWAYLAAVTVFSAAFAIFWAPLPAFLGERYDDGGVFWLFLATNLASAICYGPVGEVAAQWDSRGLQIGALATRIVLFPAVGGALLLLPAALGFPALLVAFVFLGASWAVIAVTSAGIVTRLGGRSRGEALGLYTALSGLGGGVGSLIGGWLATAIASPIAFLVAGAGVLLSLPLLFVARPD